MCLHWFTCVFMTKLPRLRLHQVSWMACKDLLVHGLQLGVHSTFRNHRTGEQEGDEIHALHHLPVRAALCTAAVWRAAYLGCGDPLRGEGPLPGNVPPVPPAGQGTGQPISGAAGDHPRGAPLHPHPGKRHQGGRATPLRCLANRDSFSAAVALQKDYLSIFVSQSYSIS